MPVHDRYDVTLDHLGDEAVVLVAGEIDLAAQDRLRAVIAQARSEQERVVIDLSATTFMDSSGVKELCDASFGHSAAGADVVLRSPSRPVRTLLELMGLWALLRVEPDPTP